MACPDSTCESGLTPGALYQESVSWRTLLLPRPRRIPNPQWDTKLAGWLQRVQSRAIEEQSHISRTSSSSSGDHRHSTSGASITITPWPWRTPFHLPCADEATRSRTVHGPKASQGLQKLKLDLLELEVPSSPAPLTASKSAFMSS